MDGKYPGDKVQIDIKYVPNDHVMEIDTIK